MELRKSADRFCSTADSCDDRLRHTSAGSRGASSACGLSRLLGDGDSRSLHVGVASIILALLGESFPLAGESSNTSGVTADGLFAAPCLDD
jgi:hypothetical protein